jgi:signal transduction histidine kinase
MIQKPTDSIIDSTKRGSIARASSPLRAQPKRVVRHRNAVRARATTTNAEKTVVDTMMIVNASGVVESVNDASVQVSSSIAGFIVGSHLAQLFRPEFARHRIDAINRAITTQRQVEIEESLAIDHAASAALETIIVPLVDSDGSCRKAVVISRSSRRKHPNRGRLRSPASTGHTLTEHTLRAREEERKRIARELHDGLGQSLAALKVAVRSIADEAPADNHQLRLKCLNTIASVSSLINETRRMAMNFSPAFLEDLGLNAAIRKLAAEVSQHHNVHVTVDLADVDSEFTPDRAINIYRILQEVFANITRHSRSTVVRCTSVRRQNVVEFTITDNGIGFDTRNMSTGRFTANNHFGLRDLEERAAILRGSIDIVSRSQSGTVVTLRVPIMPSKLELPA